MTEQLCVDPGCHPIRHQDGTHEPRLQGHLEGYPVLICTACIARDLDRLRELADLYDALLQPTRLAAGGGSHTSDAGMQAPHPATLRETATLASPSALDIRERIRAALIYWARVHVETFDHPYPDDTSVPVLVRYLDHWIATLLADPELVTGWCETIDELWLAATNCAYPSAPPGIVLGHCPTCDHELRATRMTKPVRCRGCGSERSVEDWQQVLVGDLPLDALATRQDLAAWLSARHGRDITADTVRMWSNRGIRAPGPDGGKVTLWLAHVATTVRGRHPLYSVADARTIAQHLYGDVRIGA